MKNYNIELTDDEIFLIKQMILGEMDIKENKLVTAQSNGEYVRLIEELKRYTRLYKKISKF